MAAFDFLVILLSFVFALALTHVLSRVGELVLARERIRSPGLQALVILNALTMVYLNWLTVWDARTVKTWDLLSTTLIFLYGVGNYFLCVAAAPETPAEGPIDLDASYWRRRRLFWGSVAGLMVLALAVNSVFLKTQSPRLVLETDLATLPFFAPAILALLVKARWAQWVACVGLLVLSIGWLLLFNAGLT